MEQARSPARHAPFLAARDGREEVTTTFALVGGGRASTGDIFAQSLSILLAWRGVSSQAPVRDRCPPVPSRPSWAQAFRPDAGAPSAHERRSRRLTAVSGARSGCQVGFLGHVGLRSSGPAPGGRGPRLSFLAGRETSRPPSREPERPHDAIAPKRPCTVEPTIPPSI